MLNISEIRQFIDDDKSSDRKLKAKVGKRYYEGEHDILNYRLFYYDADGNLQEDKYRTNVRISHPFFTELVDQLVQHMLSFDENPIKAKNTAEGLQEQLDTYFDEDFWSETAELLTETESQGFGYMYAYKSNDDMIRFQCADSMGVVEVRAKDTDDGCEYVIYWYVDRIDKGQKKIKRIQVWDKNQIYYYVQDTEGDILPDESEEMNPRPHIVYEDKGKLYGGSLGFIPFWRLDTCRKQTSGLKPIKSLIDDYDLMECGLTNNIQDFDTPLHVISGYQGDNLDELQQNLKTKKIVGVDSDGSIDVKTIDIPYSARKTKADEDEKNIYRFGMGLNSAGLKDTNATTNMAIKMAYTLLDLKADKLEKRLKAFLRELVEVVLDEINEKNKTEYRSTDVKFDFDRHVIINETEVAQTKLTKAQAQQTKVNTLMNLMQVAPEEQIRMDLCDVMDWDYEEIKDQFPDTSDPMDDTSNAINTLNGVNTDEPMAERSSTIAS